MSYTIAVYLFFSARLTVIAVFVSVSPEVAVRIKVYEPGCISKKEAEPVPEAIGANVIVVGTSLGAATDVSGEFLITQVPPGQYNVRASYIGYQDVLVRGINIVAGLTQTENFKLLPSAIATKEIVVISQRPLIQKSATNAIRIVNSEDLESLPVRSLTSVIALHPG